MEISENANFLFDSSLNEESKDSTTVPPDELPTYSQLTDIDRNITRSSFISESSEQRVDLNDTQQEMNPLISIQIQRNMQVLNSTQQDPTVGETHGSLIPSSPVIKTLSPEVHRPVVSMIIMFALTILTDYLIDKRVFESAVHFFEDFVGLTFIAKTILQIVYNYRRGSIAGLSALGLQYSILANFLLLFYCSINYFKISFNSNAFYDENITSPIEIIVIISCFLNGVLGSQLVMRHQQGIATDAITQLNRAIILLIQLENIVFGIILLFEYHSDIFTYDIWMFSMQVTILFCLLLYFILQANKNSKMKSNYGKKGMIGLDMTSVTMDLFCSFGILILIIIDLANDVKQNNYVTAQDYQKALQIEIRCQSSRFLLIIYAIFGIAFNSLYWVQFRYVRKRVIIIEEDQEDNIDLNYILLEETFNDQFRTVQNKNNKSTKHKPTLDQRIDQRTDQYIPPIFQPLQVTREQGSTSDIIFSETTPNDDAIIDIHSLESALFNAT